MKYKDTYLKSQLFPAIASELLAPLFARAQGILETRFKLPGRGMRSKFYPNVGALLNSMSTWPVSAHHYFGVAIRRNWGNGKKTNLLHLVCCHADVDHGPERYHKTREDALAAIENFPLRPSALVFTGNGHQPYWLFRDPLPASDYLYQVEAINKGLARALHGDEAWDASRVLRIPGTWNVKDPAHPKRVQVLWIEPDRRYGIEDFSDFAAPTRQEATPRKAPKLIDYGSLGGSAYGRAALANELARLSQMREGSHCRNVQLNKAAYALGRLVGGGHLDRGVVEDYLQDVGICIGLSEREILATLRSGLDAGMRNPKEAK